MKSFMLFEVGQQTFAYPTDKVLETIKVNRIFQVPMAPPYIKGVINLRNTVVPVIDTGVLLWDSPIDSDNATILSVGDSTVGLLVGRVLGIVEVEDEEILSKEEMDVAEIREDLVNGMFERDGKVVFIMDLTHIIKPRERKKASRKTRRETSEEKKREDLKGFVIFSLSGEWFALPVEEVREVVNYPSEVSRIPQSPDYVEGVFLLRGEEVILISMKKVLGLPEEGEEQKLIISGLGFSAIGLAVDDVKEIRWVDEESILPLEREGNRGVIVLDEGKRLALILSVGELLKGEELEDFVGGGEEEKEEEQEVSNMRTFIHFTVDSVEMAIPIEKVKEVVEVEELTPVPKAPPYIKGMYNLRNTVIAIISLPQKLNMEGAQDSNRVIVLEDFPAGLTVTRLRGILKVKEEDIQPVEDINGLEYELLEGMIKTSDGNIIFILNTENLIEEEDLRVLEERVNDRGE